MRTPKKMSENDILRTVFDHLRERPAIGVFAFHPKNESSDMRGRKSGIYYALGVEPGIPDVIVFRKGVCAACSHLESKVYALELKTEHRVGKQMTATERRQEQCRKVLDLLGVVTGIAYGLDDALDWLESHGLLRGRAVIAPPDRHRVGEEERQVERPTAKTANARRVPSRNRIQSRRPRDGEQDQARRG